MQLSMKWRLSAFIGLALLLTIGATGSVLFQSSKTLLLEQAQNNLRALLHERMTRISDFEKTQHSAFDAIASFMVRDFSRNATPLKSNHINIEFRDYVRRLLRGRSDILNVIVVDKSGHVALSMTPALVGLDYSQHAEIMNARVEPRLELPNDDHSDLTATYSGRVPKSSSGEADCIVVLYINMHPLLDVLDSSSLGQSGEIALATSVGDNALFAIAPHLSGQSERNIALSQVPIMQRSLRGEAGETRGADYRGHEVLAAFAPTAIKGWGFVAKIDVDEVYQPIRALAAKTLIVAAAFAGLALLAAYLMATRIAKPIINLATCAKNVELGDFSTRAQYDSRDELGKLSHAFNSMVKSLGEYRDKMETLVQIRTQEVSQLAKRFKAIFDHSNDAIMILDLAKDRIIDANPRASMMLGYECKQLLSTPVSSIHPDELPQIRSFAAKVFKSGAGWTNELSCRTSSGKCLPSEISASIMQIPQHHGDVLLAIIRDISERKKMELQIKQQSQELKQLNAELERFANVAAHDLKSPLGTIHGFLELLLETHGDRLDHEATEYVETVIRASSKMAKLVDSLLTYARFGNEDIDIEQVDLNSVVRQALWNLNAAIKDRHAVIQIEEKQPKIIAGNESQLIQLFQNLIGNAIKYCDADQPIVSIRAGEAGRGWEICVQDNGIGFEMAEAESIFQPFHRLRTEREYEGTGMGLAVCKRIVDRHGGTIRAESTKGDGTCFYITFPYSELPLPPAHSLVDWPRSDLGEDSKASPTSQH